MWGAWVSKGRKWASARCYVEMAMYARENCDGGGGGGGG